VVSAGREGGEVVVRVADRGPGVPEADRTRVFEPFYTTKDQSTGLGLSVCHSIVSQHGGRLGVEPRPGGGATFALRLPEEREGEEDAHGA
jgi:signal transduction histidine kinase